MLQPVTMLHCAAAASVVACALHWWWSRHRRGPPFLSSPLRSPRTTAGHSAGGFEMWAGHARAELDAKAKPVGSLGTLEEWAVTLCAVQRTLSPKAGPASLMVFCADHGLKQAHAGVSPYPHDVTAHIFRALAEGSAAAAVLAEMCGAHLTVCDVGIASDVRRVVGSNGVRVCHEKIAHGSRDLVAHEALDDKMLDLALRAGKRVAAYEALTRGALILCVGEVGIGNTTTAAALLCALSGASPSECVGRGTGVDDVGLELKREVVRMALSRHAAVEKEPRALLAALGGLEIAAMVGAYLEAPKHGCVVLVDGFIASVAALAAVQMEPTCRRHMLFATRSAERGMQILSTALNVRPALDMGLRLGEGSGAALALPLVRAAAALMGMARLDEVLAAGSKAC
uniref:Nicotinate-nucleotide--dimethylbenzimidazole phosphoribosyltransferase n=1 Tax=Calcidiscus leptoporus TaxID=127549 RepID=A0A7S0JEJ3_9EUKA|mmetsp:Transcript_5438/g.12526  ORF Transcript_5438/g.12526 Transcript_5438/m.12526 type:complete len:399 (+) Transcript_5438:48-1244(+)